MLRDNHGFVCSEQSKKIKKITMVNESSFFFSSDYFHT